MAIMWVLWVVDFIDPLLAKDLVKGRQMEHVNIHGRRRRKLKLSLAIVKLFTLCFGPFP